MEIRLKKVGVNNIALFGEDGRAWTIFKNKTIMEVIEWINRNLKNVNVEVV